MIPYGRQDIDEEDIRAVTDALRSPLLTTGPRVEAFERAFAEAVGAEHAVALSSGTAALHAAVAAADVGPGTEVIVPSMTFAATANVVVYQGATPVFCDVLPGSLLIDPACVEAAVTPRTRAIVAVDFAGQPCDYAALQGIARRHGVTLIADACHSLGGSVRGRPVGVLADLTAFSFHPVKHITTGEGGMVTTADAAAAGRMRRFRHHGVDRDHRARADRASWYYEMVELGYNYRITDIQCALGLSQLRKLGRFIERRQEIAQRYDAAFQGTPGISPLEVGPDFTHAYHLYVVRVGGADSRLSRDELYRKLRAVEIYTNVHYIPVHLHPFYRDRFGTQPGACPVAERAFEQILTLPLFPSMTEDDVARVISSVSRFAQEAAT